MIIDWINTCDIIYKTNHILETDQSERKIKLRQEIVYIRYLREYKHLNKMGSFNKWKILHGGIADLIGEDENELEYRFDLLWTSSLNQKYNTKEYNTEIKPITIYQSEVDFLNNLDAPLWIKQYWGALLFYYKFESQKTSVVYKNSTINAWCIRHTCFKSKNYGGNCQDIIAKYKKQNSVDIIKDYIVASTPAYKPMFAVNDGEVFGKYVNIDEIDQFINSIQQGFKKCELCGSSFKISSKTKRKICDLCYIKKRREQSRVSMKNLRSR